MDANLKGLKHHVEQYRSTKTDTCVAIDELDKLGQGFTSVDPLEQDVIGDGSMPRTMFINQNLEVDYKVKLIELLKEYVDRFAWNCTKMPILSRELIEHRLPIKARVKPHKKPHLKDEINQL